MHSLFPPSFSLLVFRWGTTFHLPTCKGSQERKYVVFVATALRLALKQGRLDLLRHFAADLEPFLRVVVLQ